MEALVAKIFHRGAVALLLGIFVLSGAVLAAEEKPRHGGNLIYAVGAAPPSFDAHRESTYAVIHPVSPHYSLLLKFDPKNYPKVVGDLAGAFSGTSIKIFKHYFRRGRTSADRRP